MSKKTPLSIKNHRYSWLFEPEWQATHNRMDSNSFNFFIGGLGSGKTFASLRRAEIVGVDENGDSSFLFDIDHLDRHLFFDKNDMLKRIHELEEMNPNKVKGYQIIGDEIQKSANAKEWNDRDIQEFSKEMTTIRSTRLNISLTTPTYKMVTTDLRLLGTYVAEMKPPNTIDLVNGFSYSKLHYLELKAFISEIWRRRPYLKSKFINPITKLPTISHGILNEFRWDLPSKELCRNYEKLKKEFRKKSAEERVVAIEERTTQQENKRSFSSMVDEVIANKEKFIRNGKVCYSAIMRHYDGLGRNLATAIAKEANEGGDVA